MQYNIFAQRDTTLYEVHPTRNTGLDAILELAKIACGSRYELNTYETNKNSRILIHFNLNELVDIPTNAKYYLKLSAAEAFELPYEYMLYAYAVSESWQTGTGLYNATPPLTNGASWIYRRNIDSDQVTWDVPGATYYSASEASQSFAFESPDIRMDVTNIVNDWLDNSIPNNGFLIKRSDDDESNSQVLGNIRFYSADTNTVFIPKLEVVWDDSSFVTGSTEEIDSDDYVIYFKNLQATYTEKASPILRLGVRPTYPALTYSTSSNYLMNYHLPSSSYYSVKDTVTEEIVIPFDTEHTKISCDEQGSYFKLRLNTFLPERFYHIIIKTVQGDVTNIYDNGYHFKVIR
jgi:hypothetical protein